MCRKQKPTDTRMPAPLAMKGCRVFNFRPYASSFSPAHLFDQFHSIQTEIIEETNRTPCLSLIEFFFGCKCHCTGKSYYTGGHGKHLPVRKNRKFNCGTRKNWKCIRKMGEWNLKANCLWNRQNETCAGQKEEQANSCECESAPAQND